MSKYSEYVDAKLTQIQDRILEVSDVDSVDELHEEEKDQALNKLLAKENEFLQAKESIKEYNKAKSDFKKAEQEAQESAKIKENIEDRYNQFLTDQEEIDKEQGIVPPSVKRSGNFVTINSKVWIPEDQEEFRALRNSLGKAALKAKEKQKALESAQDKLLEKYEPYSEIKAKIRAKFPSDQNLDAACIPCQLNKRNEKLAKIKQVFPKNQHFGNCGIQSSSQVIELITGDKNGEAELLKEALQNKEAELTRVQENVVKVWASKLLGFYKTDDELIDKITDLPSEELKEKIDTAATGGTWPHTREALLARHNVPSTQMVYSRDKISNALKDNKVMVAAVDASLLSGVDIDGNAVNDWAGQSPGGHAVVVADGKFDKNGNLTHVLVSDTGIGKQYYMGIDDFELAVGGRTDLNGNVDVPFNVTDDPIK